MEREDSEQEVVGCCGMIIVVMKDYYYVVTIYFGARASLYMGLCFKVLFLCFSYHFNRGFRV